MPPDVVVAGGCREEKRRSLEESKQTLVQKQASMQSSKEQWNMHSLVVQVSKDLQPGACWPP